MTLRIWYDQNETQRRRWVWVCTYCPARGASGSKEGAERAQRQHVASRPHPVEARA